MRLGPVVAARTRWSILVAPYSMEQLGELLYAQDCVPGSLRFHGEGGYLALPPSETGRGRVRWERAPLPGSAAPWVPDVEAVVDAVVRGPHSYGCERARVVGELGARRAGAQGAAPDIFGA